MNRLDRLLRIRRAGEAAEVGRWSKARIQQEARAAEAGALSGKLEAMSDDARTRLTGDLDIARLAYSAEGRNAVDLNLRRAETAVRSAEEESEARRKNLETAHRAVRALENLTDRLAAAGRMRREAAEARERDDRPREPHQP